MQFRTGILRRLSLSNYFGILFGKFSEFDLVNSFGNTFAIPSVIFLEVLAGISLNISWKVFRQFKWEFLSQLLWEFQLLENFVGLSLKNFFENSFGIIKSIPLWFFFGFVLGNCNTFWNSLVYFFLQFFWKSLRADIKMGIYQILEIVELQKEFPKKKNQISFLWKQGLPN